jgi:LacI family transcriptional regulator
MEVGDWSELSGKLAMQRLLRVSPPPEAVFVASDSMAVGALKAIRAAGLKVPENIALVGFDDIPLAAAVEPPLTTVHQPIDQLGFLAASTLIDLLETAAFETGGGARHIVLPTELVVRASCGHMLRCVAGAHSSTQPYFYKGGA